MITNNSLEKYEAKLNSTKLKTIDDICGVNRFADFAGMSLKDYLRQMNWVSQEYHNDDHQEVRDYLHQYQLRHQDTLTYAKDGSLYVTIKDFNVRRRLANIFGSLLDNLVRICYFDTQSIFDTIEKNIWHIKLRSVGDPYQIQMLLDIVRRSFQGKQYSIEDVPYQERNYLLQLTAFDQRYRSQNYTSDKMMQTYQYFDDQLVLDQQIWDDLTILYHREVSFFETYSNPSVLVGNDVKIHNQYIQGEIDFYDPESKTLIDLKSYSPRLFNHKLEKADIPTPSNRLQQLIYWRLSNVPINRLMLYNPIEDMVSYYVFKQPELQLGQTVDQILDDFYEKKKTKLKKTLY